MEDREMERRIVRRVDKQREMIGWIDKQNFDKQTNALISRYTGRQTDRRRNGPGE